MTVRGLSGDALSGAHLIETSHADIEFRWPEDHGVSFRLESTYGRIDTSFPGTFRESGSRKSLEGTQGSGAARVVLVSKNGNVTLSPE